MSLKPLVRAGVWPSCWVWDMVHRGPHPPPSGSSCALGRNSTRSLWKLPNTLPFFLHSGITVLRYYHQVKFHRSASNHSSVPKGIGTMCVASPPLLPYVCVVRTGCHLWHMTWSEAYSLRSLLDGSLFASYYHTIYICRQVRKARISDANNIF